MPSGPLCMRDGAGRGGQTVQVAGRTRVTAAGHAALAAVADAGRLLAPVTLLLAAVTEPDPGRGSYNGAPPRSPVPRWPAFGRILPWLVGVTLILVLAAAGGVATAHLVAGLHAAPSPDAAFLPTPTPRPTPSASPTVAATPLTTDAPTGGPSPVPTTTASVDPTPEATPIVYVVQPGDSISLIAARFGVTAEAIIELNNLRNPNRIIPDQRLLIPAAPASPAP